MSIGVSTPLAGWGNYFPHPNLLYRPERFAHLSALVQKPPRPTVIARGMGRGFGDGAVNPDGVVILMSRLNRFISFDPETGSLECEAGSSFEEIIRHFLPRGFFLPAVPDSRFVTVGGAIAHDVHGTNHHRDGSFCDHLEELKLLNGSGTILTCSSTQNADAFRATISGGGLTGIILSARFRLMKVPSAYLKVDYLKVPTLERAIERFIAEDKHYQYSSAWVDGLSGGEKLGRALLVRGNFAQLSDLPPRLRARPHLVPPFSAPPVPISLARLAMNRPVLSLLQSLRLGTSSSGTRLVDYDRLFFRLDSVPSWNRVYGARGFVRYHAAFPLESSRQGLTRLMEAVTQGRHLCTRARLQSLGGAGPGILSFPITGHSLAFDLPVRAGTPRLLETLDRIVLEHSGRLSLADDATLKREAFESMYPAAQEFREIRSRLDPENRFVSAQAARLGLIE